MNSFLGLLQAAGVAAIIAWSLNEASNRLRARRETKEAIGRALSELLDVHRYVVAMSAMADLMRANVPSKVTATQVISAFPTYFPLAPGIAERYSSAVASLSGPRPLLAYRLRLKEQIPAFIATLRAIPIPADGSAEALERLRDERFEKLLIDGIRDSLLELARARSLLMRWRVGRLLREPFSLPEGLMDEATRAMFNPPNTAH